MRLVILRSASPKYFCVRADLKSLRIIHGKGTGALRELVTEMLHKDTRVKGFRLGAFNEGGTGVTVADIS